jgi:hypothetical protein
MGDASQVAFALSVRYDSFRRAGSASLLSEENGV